jgi:hypothetical protein
LEEARKTGAHGYTDLLEARFWIADSSGTRDNQPLASSRRPGKGTTPHAGESAKEEESLQGAKSFTHPYTVFDLYTQSISVNKLNFSA